ncbi:hypothetical protein PMAYCL1PPCAC_13595, partial [Pristionchus mayeri]
GRLIYLSSIMASIFFDVVHSECADHYTPYSTEIISPVPLLTIEDNIPLCSGSKIFCKITCKDDLKLVAKQSGTEQYFSSVH